MSDFYRAQIYANILGTLWVPRGDDREPTEWVRLEAFDENGQPVACSETYSRTKTREPKHLRDPVFMIRMRSGLFFREVEGVTPASNGRPGFVIGTGLVIRKGSQVSTQEIANAVQSATPAGCLFAITSALSVLSGMVVCIAISIF